MNDDKVLEIAAWCVRYISQALHISPQRIRIDDPFDRLGLDSAVITSMLIELEEWLGVDIPPSVLFSQRTLREMAQAVQHRLRENGHPSAQPAGA